MDRRSKHLSSEERGVIFAEHDRVSSQRAIGQLLRRPASTICRELARGRLVHDVRRRRCRRPHKLIEGGAIHRFGHDHLVHRRWSPEQIAHRLRLMNPDNPAARVSHETRLSRDLRPATRRAEGCDDRGAAAGQTGARAPAHDLGGQRHGAGIIAHYQPPRGNRGAADPRPLGG